MIQTKESFEAYLEECRQVNKWGDKPPVDTIVCPFHENEDHVMELTSSAWGTQVETYEYHGTHWFYKCQTCGHLLTTDESVAVSLASLKPSNCEPTAQTEA